MTYPSIFEDPTYAKALVEKIATTGTAASGDLVPYEQQAYAQLEVLKAKTQEEMKQLSAGATIQDWLQEHHPEGMKPWDPSESPPDWESMHYTAMRDADMAEINGLLKWLTDNWTGLSSKAKYELEPYKEQVDTYQSLLEETEKLTSQHGRAAFPVIEPILKLPKPINPEPFIKSLIFGTLYGAIMGEVAPPWVLPINDLNLMERRYQKLAPRPNKDLAGGEYKDASPTPSRSEFVRLMVDTGEVWTTERMQQVATGWLVALASLPFTRELARSIQNYIFNVRELGKLDQIIEGLDEGGVPDEVVEEDESKGGDTYITNVYEDGDKDRDDSDITPVVPEPTVTPPYPIVTPIYNWLFPEETGTGGGSARVNCEEILSQYNLGKIPWSAVPDQCKINISGIGNPEVRGPENDYPTLI
jgi:hypothetical protein